MENTCGESPSKKITFRTCFKHFWLKTELEFTPTCSLDKWKSPILEFMQSLREQGYHKKLLAQHTAYTLILSRSLVNRLDKEETYIRFTIDQESKIVVYFDNKGEQIRLEKNTLAHTGEIKNFINKLLNVGISVNDEEWLVQQYHNSITNDEYLRDAPISIRLKLCTFHAAKRS